jgi:hypothetical protein
VILKDFPASRAKSSAVLLEALLDGVVPFCHLLSTKPRGVARASILLLRSSPSGLRSCIATAQNQRGNCHQNDSAHSLLHIGPATVPATAIAKDNRRLRYGCVCLVIAAPPSPRETRRCRGVPRLSTRGRRTGFRPRRELGWGTTGWGLLSEMPIEAGQSTAWFLKRAAKGLDRSGRIKQASFSVVLHGKR